MHFPLCEVKSIANTILVNREASSQTKHFITAATNISDHTHMNAKRHENYQNKKREKK